MSSTRARFEPLQPERISDQVVDRIQEMIVSGILKPGNQLPAERDLMEQLGVGRGSVREALRRLEGMGMLIVKPGIGTFVVDRREILDRAINGLPEADALISAVADILDAISSSGSARASEISQAVGLPEQTVCSLLVPLLEKKLVRKKEETDQYEFGYKALLLGLCAFRGWDFVSTVMPHIEELRDHVDETVALVLRVGQDYVYVGRALALREYYFTPSMGRRYPLHWAATGKSMLAFLSDDELGWYLRKVPLTPATQRTVTDPAVLMHQLHLIRQAGYAYSTGERVEGASAVAAPLFDRDGCAYAAISVIVPASRFQEHNLDALSAELLKTCRHAELACQVAGTDVKRLVDRLS